VNENKLEKKAPNQLKEKGQYVLAFGVIAAMLLVTGFPTFVIFFFGIFAYFLWKMFSMPSRNETREVFEFYLAANDVLRDDERRWYGFELQEVVNRGERILQSMHGAPPLVYFTLGALYNKIGDHKTAVNHLSYVIENEHADEATYAYPSPELRNYVKVLRKIEREPAEAPLTSAAIRALERARRNRGKALLDESRNQVTAENQKKLEAKLESDQRRGELGENNGETGMLQSITAEAQENRAQKVRQNTENAASTDYRNIKNQEQKSKPEKKEEESPFSNRKPISEVLHDIYDKNIQ
jgi:tetratricopeptide (TPR) repeat protein